MENKKMKQVMNFKITEDLNKRLSQTAKLEDRTKASIIRRALNNFFGVNENATSNN